MKLSDPKAARNGGTSRKRTRGYKVAAWIEANCVFTQGEWVGKPFCLLPWQKRILLELFELNPSGRRRYRWALIGTPKKQGKTELAAAPSRRSTAPAGRFPLREERAEADPCHATWRSRVTGDRVCDSEPRERQGR